jgi:hypothetical protein
MLNFMKYEMGDLYTTFLDRYSFPEVILFEEKI